MRRQLIPHGRGLTVSTLALVAAGALLLLAWHRSAPKVSFRSGVQPIFNAKCTACHPVAYPYLDLRAGHAYSQLVGVVSPLSPAFERVLPGRPDLSFLLTHVPDPSRRHLLSRAKRRLLTTWIAQGAKNN